MARVLVCGAGGFVGGHLVKRLMDEGNEVVAVDIKLSQEWWQKWPVPSMCRDLRDLKMCEWACKDVDAVYQLAADMGGAGYVFSGDNDAAVMHNSAQINLNIAEMAKRNGFRLFWASSACIYPAYNQTDPSNPNCAEHTAYPAACDSRYGWEKLFSEQLYDAYSRNHGIEVRIARFHNIMGTHGEWRGGREKSPAAICRKVIEAKLSGKHEIEIWGDGNQTRSFCWVGDCVEGVRRLMDSDVSEPLNIGSTEMVTINQLVDLAESFAGIKLERRYKLDAPKGVAGRNSDNTLIKQRLGWEPTTKLADGLRITYDWIEEQVRKAAQ